MDAVEDPPLQNSSVDGVKNSTNLDVNAESSAPLDVCHKSNGVVETTVTVNNVINPDSSNVEDENLKTESDSKPENELEPEAEPAEPSLISSTESSSESEKPPSIDNPLSNVEQPAEISSNHKTEEVKVPMHESSNGSSNMVEICNSNKSIYVEEVVIEETTVEVDQTELTSDRVTFQTEVLVETNDGDVIGNTSDDVKHPVEDSAGILNELSHNIELTEALRASDVTENVENNNHAVQNEVFNKEELLDILEGNNDDTSNSTETPSKNVLKLSETQIALQQLSRLKNSRRSRKIDRHPRKKPLEKKVTKTEVPKIVQEIKTEENIINVLVKDWDDEDPIEEANKILEDTVAVLDATNEMIKTQESVITQEENSNTPETSTTNEKTPGLNKTGEDSQPQRRLSRVIKKKVIFDPDNPDTFTKSKTVGKSKESEVEKELPVPKKIKTEVITPRSKSKSPMPKLQWKKPSKPSYKQNKRLSEVDKLLMDEGAVNMIYQLTPEAPKGRKNMRTKAEFIKKLQSSTPDSKEMKFRERKKELKYEEGEAKKIIGNKQRSSLSSSVKSPSAVSEDFEAHSADDSIIYRRHSSSSYSSSCMSPRRLSDVESTPQGSNSRSSQEVHETLIQGADDGNTEQNTDVFMVDGEILGKEFINKDDCLSIKEKLNSKLNLALNKRKREMSKGDKPPKVKKIGKANESISIISEEFKYVSIKIDQKLAEIAIKKTGTKCNPAILNELEKALTCIEAKQDISVTLISAECAMLCSDLELRPLLDENLEKKELFAQEILESVKSVLLTLQRHSKLICSGVSGRCFGVGLAIVGLSDVVLTSERASFSISQKSHTGATPLVPGVAVLTSYRELSQCLLNDLVVFGRRLSASEALRGGLVSRVLWPERFNEQVRALAADIASQPIQNILLKKQLLHLKKNSTESTFLSCLERESDLLLGYWTSAEGQELLQTVYNTS